MATLRFNHVFTALMLLAAVMAFVVPSRFITTHVPVVDALFAPVSRPSRTIAGWLHDSFAAPELSADKRSADLVKRENEALKNENSNLSVRVMELEKREDARQAVGDLRKLCTPFKVAGTDVGAHASLGIQGSSLQGLKDGMVAIYSGGIVGKVQRAGLAGARVQLITDAGFTVGCGFARFDGEKYIRLNPMDTVAEGTGKGAMQIVLLTHEVVKTEGLQPQDTVILWDSNWAPYLQGEVLGKITAIKPRRENPLWDQITVEPTRNLLRLREVLVVTKATEE
jgi:cell shape-determining protein MreC